MSDWETQQDRYRSYEILMEHISDGKMHYLYVVHWSSLQFTGLLF